MTGKIPTCPSLPPDAPCALPHCALPPQRPACFCVTPRPPFKLSTERGPTWTGSPGYQSPGDPKNSWFCKWGPWKRERGEWELWPAYVSKEVEVKAKSCTVTGHDSPGPGSRTHLSSRPGRARLSFWRSRLHRSRLFDLVQVFRGSFQTVGMACNIVTSYELPLGERSHICIIWYFHAVGDHPIDGN